jgi:serine/threonine protein kinase
MVGRYTYDGAKAVVMGVCKAAHSLHERNIIHRDIKPENIIITDKGTVKLIDLNASRIQKGSSQDTVRLGTIGYASPEQLGVCESDRRSDIYAIGVLLNVMLTGEHPSKCIARGKAGRIVKKCTDIDPNSRYDTVYELMKAL